MNRLVWLALCGLLATGCATARQDSHVHEERRERVLTVRDTVRDTVERQQYAWRHDSTTVSVRGDTVYVDRWHKVTVVRTETARHTSATWAADSTTTARVDSTSRRPVGQQHDDGERPGRGALCVAAVLALCVAAVAWRMRK